MRKKGEPGLEKNLESLGDILLVVGGAALGRYLVQKFTAFYGKQLAPIEQPTYEVGFGDADLGLMPANTYYHRK